MKTHTEYLTFNIPSKMAFQNITPQVEAERQLIKNEAQYRAILDAVPDHQSYTLAVRLR